jgi:predicted O-methyltransferase YrrM
MPSRADHALEPRARLESLADAVEARSTSDRYGWVQRATRAHRAAHGCGAYTFDDGTTLTALAHATQASTVLELGTAAGYTACCWAHHGAAVDTIDHDRSHAELAAAHVARAKPAGRIRPLHGDFFDVLATPLGAYDVVFFDGFAPDGHLLDALIRHIAPGGLLVTTNLVLADRGFGTLLGRIPGSATVHLDANLALTAFDQC